MQIFYAILFIQLLDFTILSKMDSMHIVKFMVAFFILTTDLTSVSSKGSRSNHNGRGPNLVGDYVNTEYSTLAIAIVIGFIFGLIILFLICHCIGTLIRTFCAKEDSGWIAEGLRNESANLSPYMIYIRNNDTQQPIGWNVDELKSRYPNLTTQENNEKQQPKTHKRSIPYRVSMMKDGSDSVPSHKSILEYDSIKIPRCTIHK